MKAERNSRSRRASAHIPGPKALSETTTGDNPPQAAIIPTHAGAHSDLQGFARVFHLDPGVYAIIIGATPSVGAFHGELVLPMTEITPGPVGDRQPVQIIIEAPTPTGWLSSQGGIVIAKAPRDGGDFLVTTFGLSNATLLPSVDVVALGHPVVAAPKEVSIGATRQEEKSNPVRVENSAEQLLDQEIAIEMTAHIEREGDRRFRTIDWVGNPGQHVRLEAFTIRPMEAIRPIDIEYMALGPGNRRTSWITDGNVCGTRRRGAPLTGFAVRLVPDLRDAFDVAYEGSFFHGGVVGPNWNGDPCISLIVDDPLEAIRLRVIKKR